MKDICFLFSLIALHLLFRISRLANLQPVESQRNNSSVSQCRIAIMADALSMVASTVGMASMAIKLNHRLVELYQSLSPGDDRINFVDLANEVQSYAALLKAIHLFLEEHSSIAGQDALRTELNSARVSFQLLEHVLRKYEDRLRPGATGSLFKALRRSILNERKWEINQLKNDLRARTTNLGLLLNMAQMLGCHRSLGPTANISAGASDAVSARWQPQWVPKRMACNQRSSLLFWDQQEQESHASSKK